MNTLKYQTIIGAIVWIAIIFFNQSHYKSGDWHIRMIELAALAWLPLGISVLEKKAYINFHKWLKNSILICSVLLIFALENSNQTYKYCALPYLFLTIWVAVNAVENWIFMPKDISNTTLTLAQVLLVVASSWTIAHCFAFRPLGFDAEIVTLTGVHFHYAGFLLLSFAGLNSLYSENFFAKTACHLLMWSVPMTAIGITVSHYFQRFELEAVAAIVVVLGAYSLAISILDKATKSKIERAVSGGVFACVLLFSMSLALMYAIRTWFPLEWLTIPYMKAIHGTCNGLLIPSFGFAFYYFFEKNKT